MADRRFARFAWFFVVYLILVILFGAWVRISGSGNGCGSHWPMCNGEVIPQAPTTKTIIEFSHRLSSGLSGVFGIVLVVWSRRAGRKVFRAALVAFFFLLVESFIGAVLVKKELVAGDASASRALVISLHLVNTMLLVASATTAAWWASVKAAVPPLRAVKPLLVAVVVAIVLTNVTGAVTALGDTLFPTQPALDGSLLAKVRDDISASQHFLVRLRVVHPLVAATSAMLIAVLFLTLLRKRAVETATRCRLFHTGLAAVCIQVLLGIVNIALAAPGWMQVIHLLMAQIVWVAVWLTVLEAWQSPS